MELKKTRSLGSLGPGRIRREKANRVALLGEGFVIIRASRDVGFGKGIGMVRKANLVIYQENYCEFLFGVVRGNVGNKQTQEKRSAREKAEKAGR